MQATDNFSSSPGAVWQGLMSAKTIVPLTDGSRSNFHAMVRENKFPKPAIQLPRYTRWKASDVQEWLSNPSAYVAAHANQSSVAP